MIIDLMFGYVKVSFDSNIPQEQNKKALPNAILSVVWTSICSANVFCILKSRLVSNSDGFVTRKFFWFNFDWDGHRTEVCSRNSRFGKHTIKLHAVPYASQFDENWFIGLAKNNSEWQVHNRIGFAY